MNLEQYARIRTDGRTVVLEPCLVGRADFDQAGTALTDHIRHTEAAADLHELTSRHDHLAAVAERREHEQDGRRAVVDRERGFGRRQLAQQRLDRLGPRSAPAGREIEFEIAVGGGDLRDRRYRLGCERSAAEIGVQNDARGVDGSP